VARRLFSRSHFILPCIGFPSAIPTYPHYRAMIFSPVCCFSNKILFSLEFVLNIGHILDVPVSVLASGLFCFAGHSYFFFQEMSLLDVRHFTLRVLAPHTTSLDHLIQGVPGGMCQTSGGCSLC
jgi:hypothetical protein